MSNGNCSTTVFADGTKIREWPDSEKPWVEYPESLDLKITNYCVGAKCVAHCHEKSNKYGKHANPAWILKTLEGLPAQTEIAIGGGNPLEYPDLEDLLRKFKDRKLISNLTVNATHLRPNIERLHHLRNKKLIWGLGVSYIDEYKLDVAEIWDENTILHVIAGVHQIEDIIKLPRNWKILVLGFKNYGNGSKYIQLNPVNDRLMEWNFKLGRLMRGRHVSFDNLAVNQLRLKDRLTTEAWDKYYMGDDGQFTMYIDAVTESFAASSTKDRIPTNGQNIFELFKEVRHATD